MVSQLPIPSCLKDYWAKRPGDKISHILTPVARVIGSDCVDPKTGKLKPQSGCGKMTSRLNAGMSIAEAAKLRIRGK